MHFNLLPSNFPMLSSNVLIIYKYILAEGKTTIAHISERTSLRVV